MIQNPCERPVSRSKSNIGKSLLGCPPGEVDACSSATADTAELLVFVSSADCKNREIKISMTTRGSLRSVSSRRKAGLSEEGEERLGSVKGWFE